MLGEDLQSFKLHRLALCPKILSYRTNSGERGRVKVLKITKEERWGILLFCFVFLYLSGDETF